MKKERDFSNSEMLKEKARKVSIKEGTAANISSTLGDNYMIPFALALKANPFQIGILSSFSGFLYQLAQLAGTKMMEKRSRKSIVLSFVFLQALMWAFIALVGYLVWRGLFDGYSVWLLILFYSLVMFFGGITYPAWFSWMGDIIQEDKRGAYFSKRNKIATFFSLIALALASFFLDYYKTKGLALLAFSVLFSLAFGFRFISYLLFQKQYAPKFKQNKKDYFSLISFIKRYDNFGKFAVYQGFFNLSVMIASPFFTVYVLSVLNFSYKMFTLSLISYYLIYMLALPLAGKFSDKYGNRKLAIIMNFFFILTPIVYILSKEPWQIIILAQLSAGIASAAAVISFSNFIYDSVSPKHRSICVSYTNVLVGIGTLVGAFLGGIIVETLHPTSINPFIFVFAIAAILRASVALFFLPQVKEVKKVRKLPSSYNFFFHPIHFAHHAGMRLVHYPEKALGKFKSLKSLVSG